MGVVLALRREFIILHHAMRSRVSYLKFIQLVFRQGSLRVRRVDFHESRAQALAGLDVVNQRSTHYTLLRRWLMKWAPLYFLLHNATTLKNRHRVLKQYFISPGDRLVFIRIFKNASTSVLKGLLPRLDSRLVNQALTSDQVDAIAQAFSAPRLTEAQTHYTCFAIVRDPFRRLVSAYRDVFDAKASVFAYEGYLFGIFRREMDFPAFVRTLHQLPDVLRGPHFVSQSRILSYVKNVIVYRLETDGQALAEFLGTYKIPLVHENASADAYDYRAYYDRETIERVSQIYRDDILAYGYESAADEIRRSLKE